MNPNTIYDDICGFSPTPEQIAVYNILARGDAFRNPLLLRLPCGCGKTEAVVIPYLAQSLIDQWSLAPRLIYVLPTRALCNQIRDRVQTYADKVNQLNGKEMRVGIEHGISSLDPLFFADVCVTTFDQFLYGYARAKRVGRHFDLPAGSIATSVVVFDEAHLYSPYTHSLMRAMIEILVTSRIPTIVMTATIPATLESDLLRGINEPTKIEFAGKWLNHMANRSIRWRQEDWGLLKGESLSDDLNALLRRSKDKRVLIVANRIDVAQKVASALKGRKGFITLIHSRFTAEDRGKKERDVCKCFGKNREDKKPGIVVSTQVCEVGLDISCDILITECAAADALVQRVGRLARWGGEGEVFVVKPMGGEDPIDDSEWGMAYPYVDKKKDEESEFPGIKMGEFGGIAWKYLRQKADDNLFIEWSATTEFCNKMDYHADDVEARSALGQLFDATLYADERPWNLSARGDLYCTLAVVSEDRLSQTAQESSGRAKKGKKKQKRRRNEQLIPFQELRECLVNVPFRYLVTKDTRNFKTYDFLEGKVKDKLGKGRAKPFQTYILDPTGCYNTEIGLALEKMEKPDNTEEGASCLIL